MGSGSFRPRLAIALWVLYTAACAGGTLNGEDKGRDPKAPPVQPVPGGDAVVGSFFQQGVKRNLTRQQLEAFRASRTVPRDEESGKIWHEFGVAWYDLRAWVYSVAFSPDDSEIAVGMSGRVAFLDPQTLAPRRSFQAQASGWGVTWSPDGKFLAIGSGSKGSKEPTLVQVHTRDGQHVRSLGHFRDSVSAIEFSPDGKYLAAMDGGGPLQLKGYSQLAVWRVADWHPVCDFRNLELGEIHRWVLHWVDSSEVLLSSYLGLFRVKVPCGESARLTNLETGGFAVRSPWVLARESSEARPFGMTLYRLEDGKLATAHAWARVEFPGSGIVLDRGARLAFSAGEMGFVGVVDLHSHLTRASMRVHSSGAKTSLSKDGLFLVTAGGEGTISMIDVHKLLGPIGPGKVVQPGEGKKR